VLNGRFNEFKIITRLLLKRSVMKGKTLKFIISLAVVSVAGVFLIQFGFLKSSYNLTEKQFRESTSIALKEVAWQVLLADGNTSSFDSITPVEIVTGNYFLVNVNAAIDKELLKMHLVEEFRKHDVYNDFEFAIYNPALEQMDEGILISKGVEKPSKFTISPPTKNTSTISEYISQTVQLFLHHNFPSGIF
jgi:two-component system, OmpR family, phosphate regulon sensor histidine kinase PhoR